MYSIFRKLFMSGTWQMAYRINEKHWPIDYSIEFKQIKNDKKYWYADPLLFETNGKIYLFCEAFNKKEEKGEIAVLEWGNGNWKKPRVIISNNYHMSYPFVFSYKGEYYLIPESAESGNLEMYISEEFPYKWKKYCNIIKNIKLADPTVFEFDNSIYLYAWDETEKQYRSHVYKLDVDKQKCIEISTISYEYNNARPAGHIIYFKNSMIRPAQNSKNIYGENIIWYDFSKDIDGFKETVIDSLDVNKVRVEKSYGLKRIHTFSYSNNIEVIDYCQFKFDLFKRIKILKRKWMTTRRNKINRDGENK